jgi:hypothetical protein
MPIVDPFDTPAPQARKLVDPFEAETTASTEEPKKQPQERATPRGEVGGGGRSFFDFNPLAGPMQTLGDFASRAVGPLKYPMAAVNAATGFVGGHPLAALEQLAGEYGVNPLLRRYGVPEERLQHPTHEQLYGQAREDVNRALAAAGPARGGSIATTATPFGQAGRAVEQDILGTQVEDAVRAAKEAAAKRAAKQPPDILQAQEALRQEGYDDLGLPRAITSQSDVTKGAGQALSKFPLVGTPLREAVQAVPGRVGAQLEDIAAQHGTVPEEAIGGRIAETIGGQGARETEEAQIRARALHQQAVADWERANQEREGAIRAQEAEATHARQRQFGDVHPTEMAERTIADVQQAHAADEAANQARWEAVNSLNAPVSQRAFEGLHGRVEQGITNAGVTLGKETTPNALEMMGALRRLTPTEGTPPTNLNARMLAGLEREYGAGNIPDEVVRQFGGEPGTPGKPPDFGLMGEHAPQAGDAHVSAQGIDELRKRISQMAHDARLPADQRASRAIKRQFENWRADAFENHLLPGGDPNANAVIRNAVGGHRNFMEKFGYNYGDMPRGMHRTAADELNQIATAQTGPTDTALKLVGHMPGGKEVSHPLYQRILGAVQNPGAVRDRLRGSYWRETNTGSPDVAANRIANLAVSPMGRELFTPQELAQMHEHGRLRQQTVLDLQRAREVAGKRPTEARVVPGEAQQLATKVIGNRSNEKVFSNLDAMARGGDARNFSRAWNAMPEETRNDFRGAFIRNLGRDGDNFSLAKFVSAWDKYPPQSKAVIFGSGGPQGIQHFADLNNFHRIAREYADTVAKYGNPSGTAQVTMWHKIFTGALKAGAGLAALSFPPGMAIGTAAMGLGLYKFSKVLASPYGARELSRWARMAETYNRRPSVQKLKALSRMSHSLNQQGP